MKNNPGAYEGNYRFEVFLTEARLASQIKIEIAELLAAVGFSPENFVENISPGVALSADWLLAFDLRRIEAIEAVSVADDLATTSAIKKVKIVQITNI